MKHEFSLLFCWDQFWLLKHQRNFHVLALEFNFLWIRSLSIETDISEISIFRLLWLFDREFVCLYLHHIFPVPLYPRKEATWMKILKFCEKLWPTVTILDIFFKLITNCHITKSLLPLTKNIFFSMLKCTIFSQGNMWKICSKLRLFYDKIDSGNEKWLANRLFFLLSIKVPQR